MAHSKHDNDNNAADKYFSKRPPTKAPRKYGLSGGSDGRAKAKGGKSAAKPAKPPQNNIPASQSRLKPKGAPPPKRPPLSVSPAALKAAAGVCLAVVLVFTLWFLTRKNAYEVYVAGNLEGTIAMSKDVTEEFVYTTAVAKLAREVGSNVAVSEEVTFKAVHANEKELATPEYVIGSIYKKWPYQIEASIITLDGVNMATLKSAQEAEDALNRLAAQYIAEDASLAGAPEFEGVEITKKYVDPDVVDSVEAACAALNTTKEKTRGYDVQSGDSLGKIAAGAGMTIDGLLTVNPGLRIDSTLVIGQTLTLVSLMPLVSVTTVEVVTREEPVPKGVDQQENPSQHTSYTKVVQEGSDGLRKVTEHVTRVNGVAVKTEPVSDETIVEPVNEIVEVGTSSVITAR